MDYAKLAAEARRLIGNRSAWGRGVQQYATALVESLEEHSEYLKREGKLPITRSGLQAAGLSSTTQTSPKGSAHRQSFDERATGRRSPTAERRGFRCRAGRSTKLQTPSSGHGPCWPCMGRSR